MQIIRSIQNRIYEIRGERVLLDFDLAALYDVGTKVLNQAVKRNIERFPKDFMFQLTHQEFEILKSEIIQAGKSSTIVKTSDPVSMRSQIVTAYQKKRNSNALPYAFTE